MIPSRQQFPTVRRRRALETCHASTLFGLLGLTEEGLAEAWAYLAGMAGAYESHGDTDAVRAGDFTITNTPLAFEAGDFGARVTFRDNRTIAGLYMLDPEVAKARKPATTC
ncbi:DUF3887 domain-containing protein [Mycobacterium kyogaense]|uniref:DUF3887 domain-containing protein n=1 Tax=Mycobacterium kyogaense TaxID=2212479 RepID=UPI000DAC296D|nr:DUF3887 domain-containing protein [Mycobacterium kyogaense]